MAKNIVEMPYEYFPNFNKDGPIYNGKIFIGEINTDPEIIANQKDVTYQDACNCVVETPIIQPIRTGSGGVPIYNNSPVRLFVNGSYSIKVLDKNNNQIYYTPNVTNGAPVTQEEFKDAILSLTIADAIAKTDALPGVTQVRISDRGNGLFTYKKGLTPDGKRVVDATGSSLQLVSDEKSLYVNDCGAIGDGATQNQQDFFGACLGNGKEVISSDGEYVFNEEITITESENIYGKSLKSIINQKTADKKVFSFNDNGSSLTKSPTVSNLTIKQVNASTPGGGTANNHAPIAFSGVYNGQAYLNWLDKSCLGIKFENGSNSLPERSSSNGLCLANTFNDLQKMAIENIGARETRILGNSVDGAKSTGVRGESHSLRMTGYSPSTPSPGNFSAECHGVVGSSNIFKGMLTGFSAQNTASYWSLSSTYVNDVQVAFQVLQQAASDATVSNGSCEFTFKDVNQLINNNGGEFLSFNFNGSGIIYDSSKALSGNAIIESSSPSFGGSGHNRYKGIIKDIDENGIDIRYKNSVLDISIINANIRNTANSFAARLISGADGCTGSIVVDGCEDGVIIFSDNNILDLNITGANPSKKAITLAGNNNTIRVFTDGDVAVSGINNVITGNVTGDLTDTSSDPSSNNYSNLIGFAKQKAEFSKVTTASGEVTVTHGLKTSNLSVLSTILGSNSNSVRVKSLNSTSLVFEFRDSLGSLLNAQSVSFYWRAEAYDS